MGAETERGDVVAVHATAYAEVFVEAGKGRFDRDGGVFATEVERHRLGAAEHLKRFLVQVKLRLPRKADPNIAPRRPDIAAMIFFEVM